jgi:UDP-glucose 4-epimerase
MILVTGASGFVGGAVVAEAARRGLPVRGASRSRIDSANGADYVIGPDLDEAGNWASLLTGVHAVVHAAARVHVMRDRATDPLAEFRHVNVAGTMRLARQAAAAGVRRFLFISSIKVNGEGTTEGSPYRPDSPAAPADPYGISKREAEDQLRELSRNTGMEVVVIRPVLVYGPGVRANFRALMRLAARGIPLPLGAIDNRRSLVALPNLVDLILLATSHGAAAGEVLLVSDGHDVSTPTLLQALASHMGRRARLVPVPTPILRAMLAAVGKSAEGRRLCGSLQVDITLTRERLGWSPPVSFDDAIAETVDHFLYVQGAR